MDIYAYGGGYEHEPNGALAAPASNASCDVPSAGGTTLPSACTTATIKQATGGFWWKFYKGELGYLMTGVQVSATNNKTFRAADNTYGKANDLMAFYCAAFITRSNKPPTVTGQANSPAPSTPDFAPPALARVFLPRWLVAATPLTGGVTYRPANVDEHCAHD